MDRQKVLLVVEDGPLRASYEWVLRFCGLEPVSLSAHDAMEQLPEGTLAACVLADHRPLSEALCSKLLASAVPLVRIDPFIRHAREHLPFDVVLPAFSEPRQLITALRHLVPSTAHPA
jgi:hypothetical protein